jgi:hypothetical protein
LLALLLAAGCHNSDVSPPPPRVDASMERAYYSDPAFSKPLPPREDREPPPPPFYDPPLVSQHMPEEQAFLNAYNAVNRPPIVVFVNRTLEGEIVPANSAQNRQTYDPRLRVGQYDEGAVKSIDYHAIEFILADWLSCDNHVTIISPTMARDRLTDEQIRDLQSGRPHVARDIAMQLGAPILVQVQAHVVRSPSQELGLRVFAEAIDVQHDSGSLARAVVEVPLPLDREQTNGFTRFMARRLMDGMTASWQSLMAPSSQRGQPDAGRSPLLPGQNGFVPPPNPSSPNPSNVPPTQAPAVNSGVAPNPANPLPEPVPLSPASAPATQPVGGQ